MRKAGTRQKTGRHSAPPSETAHYREVESGIRLPDPRSVFANLVEVVRFPTPVLSPGSDGQWDESDIHSHFAIRSGSQVFMYYNGLPLDRSDGGIGLAISNDGFEFRKHDDKPVIPVGGSGQWDSGHLWKMDVLRIAPQDWRMWYGGFEKGDKLSRGRTGYATSKDGLRWEKHPANPVLEPGKEAWEQGCVADLRVVYDQSEGKFHGLYYGCPKTVRPSAIGYAWSHDGVVWTKYEGNPVMAPAVGGGEGDLISPKHFMKIGDVYVVFYEALHGGRAFHTGNAVAYSYDCIHWVRDSRNPFQRDVGDELPVDPSVLIEEGWFRNYYGMVKPSGGFLGLSYSVSGPSRKIVYPVLVLDSLAGLSSSSLNDSTAVDLGYVRGLALSVEARYEKPATRGIRVHVYASADNVSYDTRDYAVFEQPSAPGETVRTTESVAPHARWLKVVVENLDEVCAARSLKVLATVQAP